MRASMTHFAHTGTVKGSGEPKKLHFFLRGKDDSDPGCLQARVSGDAAVTGHVLYCRHMQQNVAKGSDSTCSTRLSFFVITGGFES